MKNEGLFFTPQSTKKRPAEVLAKDKDGKECEAKEIIILIIQPHDHYKVRIPAATPVFSACICKCSGNAALNLFIPPYLLITCCRPILGKQEE